MILSVALVASWYYTKYWLLSNILAICVACAIVKIFRFNALYPAFLVLLGFLVFDIFWVFMGPALFSGHSIIHEVQNDLDFPLKLAVPGFNPFVPCATLSIIDIVVPTFYISFISRFGKEQQTNIYYLAHITAYAISLGIFTLVMVYSGTKQPALLYIIPSLFFTTFVVAGLRREWGSKLSLDSAVEADGFRPNGKKNTGQDKGEEPTARGMEKFDVRDFTGAKNIADFRKFEDESAKEENP